MVTYKWLDGCQWRWVLPLRRGAAAGEEFPNKLERSLAEARVGAGAVSEEGSATSEGSWNLDEA